MKFGGILICLFSIVLISVWGELTPILKTTQAGRRAAKFASTRTKPIPGSTPTHLNNNFGALRERVKADNDDRERNSQRYEEYKRRGEQTTDKKGGTPTKGSKGPHKLKSGKSKRGGQSAAEYVNKVKTSHFKNKMSKNRKF
mgnify:CR=1 FL=1